MRPVTVIRAGSFVENVVQGADHIEVVNYAVWMESAKLAQDTITARVEILRRLQHSLPDGDMTGATRAQLEAFQASVRHLQPASVNVYTRHIRSFYAWLAERGVIDVSPAAALPVPKVYRGQPHPATVEQVRTIFACTTGSLRVPYALAAFAGLRCGEICRLQSSAVDMTGRVPTAVVHGKGGRERTVPILPPLAAELGPALLHRGWVARQPNGLPYSPNQLSVASSTHLKSIGVDTTLHSLRHSFATWAARATRDPLLVRDLLGHVSVATTEIYMATAATTAFDRLQDLVAVAADILSRVS